MDLETIDSEACAHHEEFVAVDSAQVLVAAQAVQDAAMYEVSVVPDVAYVDSRRSLATVVVEMTLVALAREHHLSFAAAATLLLARYGDVAIQSFVPSAPHDPFKCPALY